MFKRITALLMIMLLAVSTAACGGGAGESSNGQVTVSYAESEIGSNSELTNPAGARINSKDQLVVCDVNGRDSRYVTLDSVGNQVGEIKPGIEGSGGLFTLDAKDNLYILSRIIKDGSASQKLYKVAPDGKILNTIDIKSTSPMDYIDIAVDSKGNIYLASMQSAIDVLDGSGKKLKTIGSNGYMGLEMDPEDNLIAFSMNMPNMALEKINTSTGEQIWKQDIQQKGGSYRIGSTKLRYSKKDKCIYMLTSSGIDKFDSSGKKLGTELDFAAYTLLASGYSVSDMNLDSNGDFYVTTLSMMNGKGGAPVMVQKNAGGNKAGPGMAQSKGGMVSPGTVQSNGGMAGPGTIQSKGVVSDPGSVVGQSAGSVKYEIYIYTPQTGNEAEKQKVIRLFARRSENFLQVAAARFQKEHPGYRVSIETPDDNTQSNGDISEYVNNLNTQILSGKGPDIMSTYWLPYENYISKNILADLGGMIDKDLNKSDYYTNILDAMKTGGKTYLLPVSFSFNVLMANKGILDQEAIKIDDSKWTWNDFMSIAKKLTKKDASGNVTRSALPDISSQDLLDDILIFGGDYSSFVNRESKSASFDSQDFINLLNIVKSFGNSKAAASGVKQNMASIVEAAGRGSIVFEPDQIQDYMKYSLSKTGFNGKISLLKMPSDTGAKGGRFNSDQTFAINNSSKYKKEAWDFLKILLSEDIQSTMDFPGISINKAAQGKKAQQAIDATTNGKVSIVIKGGSNTKPITPKPLTKADVDYVDSFIPGLNTFSSLDEKIMDIIHDETEPFFSGDKSAEEVAKLIQNRVNIYLNE